MVTGPSTRVTSKVGTPKVPIHAHITFLYPCHSWYILRYRRMHTWGYPVGIAVPALHFEST